MFEKIIEMSLLFDFYGQLLTPKQQEILRMYYEDNYTLAEIAEDLGISRQAVYDSIKKAEKTLHDYDEKLDLTHKFLETDEAIRKINDLIRDALSESGADITLQKRLLEIKIIMDKMNE